MAWVFTQHEPLNTSSFIDQAKRRGVTLDLSSLRELYRFGLLVPFVYVTNRAVRARPRDIGPEPILGGGTLLIEFRYARDRGRLTDLASESFRPRLRINSKPSDSRGWWNGFIYSWYQLLVVPDIKPLMAHAKQYRRHGKILVRLREPHPVTVHRTNRLRRIAVALAALEARYLPNLDPEWISLVNTHPDEWTAYCRTFDPKAVSDRLGYPAAQAREDAEWLLMRAKDMDPVGDDWAHLIRRAPRKSWDGLKDAALCAMDYREAAEILLRFYEELASRGHVEALPSLPEMAWHPLHDRLSNRPETLDQDLMRLGLSPHPRVVLAVEGEAEEVHAPQVGRTLGYPDAPELVRVLHLGGVGRDLQKVAALAAAPLVGEKLNIPGRGSWSLIKPPTRLVVAVDPEGKYSTPEKVEQVRTGIIKEIQDVLSAQGVTDPNQEEIDQLVRIHTWQEPCYEFAHFTDDELADGIMSVHETVNGLTRDQLIQALAATRRRGKDIKEVWSRWDYKVSKVKLAEALWPTLAAKIQACKVSEYAPVPPIAEIVQEAYRQAQQWRYHSFVLSESAAVAPKSGQAS